MSNRKISPRHSQLIAQAVSVWVTARTVGRIIRTKPKYWLSRCVDDHNGAVVRQLMDEGVVLDDDILTKVEGCIATEANNLARAGAGAGEQAPVAYIGEDTVNVLDPDHDHTVLCRRWLDQEVSDVHAQSAYIMSNTMFGIDWEQYDILMECRSDLPVRAKQGMTREGWLPRRVVQFLSPLADVDSLLLKTPYGNFDYRMRKYSWEQLSITGNPRLRSLVTCPLYDFSDEVRTTMETKVLRDQFNLTPDEALSIAKNNGYKYMKEGGSAPVLRACRAYHHALISGSCDYWGEFDAIGSGIINGWMQLGQVQAVKSGDKAHPDFIHPRTLFAIKVSMAVSTFAGIDPEASDIQTVLKSSLPACQYGAGETGVYKALTGRKVDSEAPDVDWEQFAKVNAVLHKLYPYRDESHSEAEAAAAAQRFDVALQGLCASLAQAYADCFPDLKKAEGKVSRKFVAELESNQIPEFTSHSGSIMRGPVYRRIDGNHDALVLVDTELGRTSTTVECGNKNFDPQALTSVGLSWVLHNIDAEIISLVTVRCHKAGIPCFTNHDAIFIPLWAYDQVCLIFAKVVEEVNSTRVLVDTFNCRSLGKTPKFSKAKAPLV